MSTIIDGSAGVTTNTGAVYNSIQSATAQASTSGTNIDFTSIPSWVKRITVMFNGVSTNGTNIFLVQIGTSSGIVSTGYISTYSAVGTSTPNTASTTSGFGMYTSTATEIVSGIMVLTNISGNTWVSSHTAKKLTTVCLFGGGDVALSGTLDRVRITTVGGTDTFDAGSINILYE